MEKNGKKAFASTEELTPVKVTVGDKELFVYHADEDVVYTQVAESFNGSARRTYVRQPAAWGEETGKARRGRPKKEIAQAAAAA